MRLAPHTAQAFTSAEIRRWLEGNGIAPDKVEWYVELESGRKMTRPAFDQL